MMTTNPADPKWLEILLKTSGWQMAALTVACLLILVFDFVPTTNSALWRTIFSIAAVIFGCLSLAAILRALAEAIKPGMKIAQWRLKRKKIKEAREHIPYMTDKEREIIGYLLYHNQKMFQTNQDGGYAAPLLNKGIIKVSLRHGQVCDPLRVPFEIPDDVWSVLEKNKKLFSYSPPPEGESETHPWAIPWMVR